MARSTIQADWDPSYNTQEREVIVLVDEYDTPAVRYFAQVFLYQPSLVSILVNLLKANDSFRDVFQALLKVGVLTFYASLPI